MKGNSLTDREVELLRKANVPVPETTEELAKLLEEAERDPKRYSLEAAFKDIRKRLAERHGTSQRA
jgi:hypothetical protein